MWISVLNVGEEEREVCDFDVGASMGGVSRDVVDVVEYVDTEYIEVFEDDVRDEVCDEALEGWADGNGDGEE